MYTLYSRPGSSGFIVEAALKQAGIPFRMVTIKKGAPPEGYSKVNPLNQVPSLTLPDGRTITESAAMCILLADSHPGSGLGPAPGDPHRPEFLRWLMFLTSMLYPALMRYFYPQRSTTDPGGIERVKDAAMIEFDRYFEVIDAGLAGRRWLAGERRSIADVYLLLLAYWHPVADRPRPEWTNINRVCEELKKDPILAEVNEGHRLWQS